MEGENITSQNIFTYDAENDVYIANVGGEYRLVITTSNKKYPEFKVKVKVGNGESSNPYFIRNKEQFNSIKFNKCYLMLGDVTLDSNTYLDFDFAGVLDGNGYTVKGLSIAETNNNQSVGLFKSISGNAVVKNLTIDGATIDGTHDYVGALAGSINGSANIVGVQVKNSNITNRNANGYMGGLAGSVATSNVILCSVEETELNIGVATEDTTEPTTREVSVPKVGGLLGYADKSTIKASYANVVLKNNATINYDTVAGFVGEIKLAPATVGKYDDVKGIIHQSYAVVTGEAKAAAFVGKISADNKITETSWDTDNGKVTDGTNTHTYAYFIGNYAFNNSFVETDTVKVMPMVNSYSENAKTVYNRITTVVADKPETFVNVIKEDSAYLYYKNIEWDVAVWDMDTARYPKLKLNLGANENSISTVPASYIATTIKTTATTTDELDNALNNDNIGNVEADLTETELDWTDKVPSATVGSLTFTKHTTIKVKDSLFTTFKGSLENVTIVVEYIENASDVYGGVANKLLAGSTLNNVNVKFNCPINKENIVTFGGVVGEVEANTTITNCSATGINITSSKITTAGGVVGKLAGGLVVANNKVAISNFNSSENATIGGLVGELLEKGYISNGNSDNNGSVEVSIILSSVGNGTRLGGVVGNVNNNAKIENLTLTGVGIEYKANMVATDISFAGVAATNNGTISNVYNRLLNIANKTTNAQGEAIYGYVGASNYNYKVAGVAWNNAGTINKAIVTTNLYGNYVAGVVGETTGTISEVFVTGANWNKTTNYVLDSASEGTKFSEGANIISGNKYVAGVAYAINSGNVTDVQTNSVINAGSADAKASLIVLRFPNGANVKDFVINNKFEGNTSATYYRDTMVGGEIRVNAGKTYEYNIYGLAGGAGVMKSVLINMDTMRSSGTVPANNYVQARFGQYWSWFSNHVEYNENGNGSYVREVNNEEFANEAMYTSSFTLMSTRANSYNYKANLSCGSKQMTFSQDKWIGAVESNAGKILRFVSNLDFTASV